MADSESSTTLPRVTRRRMLAGTVIAIGAWGSNALALTRRNAEAGPSSDPAIALWRQWQDANQLTERLGREQQDLERQLADTVGFPYARFQVEGGEYVKLHSLRAIQEVLRCPPVDAAILAKAEADFAAHELRWDRAGQEIGYSAAVQAERDAADRAENLLEAFAVTPATSLAGVAAKLDAMLQESERWDDGAEFPCPQLRSALDDLAHLSQQLFPGQPFPWEGYQLKPRRGDGERAWNAANGGAE